MYMSAETRTDLRLRLRLKRQKRLGVINPGTRDDPRWGKYAMIVPYINQDLGGIGKVRKES